MFPDPIKLTGVRRLAALALVVPALVGTELGAQAASSVTEEIRAALARVDAQTAGAGGADESVARDLAELPVEGLATLFEALVRHKLAPGDAELTLEQIASIEHAFRIAPTERVRSFLRTVAEPADDLDTRRIAIHLYGDVGGRAELSVVMRLADVDEASELPLGEDFRDAFAAILERTPEAVGGVSGFVRSMSKELTPFFAHALGDVGHRDGFAALVGILELRPELASVTLDQIQRVAERNESPFWRDVTDATRELLDTRDDDALLERAVAASGSLEDPLAAATLLELLDADSPRVRTAAYRALVRISGQKFKNGRAMWETWLGREARWYDEELPRLSRDLASDDPLVAGTAIRGMVGHTLYRHELAQLLAPSLSHDDPSVAMLACVALGQLGSAAAVPALEQALAEAELAPHAEAALLSIRPTKPTAGRRN